MEDSYGVVQRDIPRILEALLSFLTALEDYHSELLKKYPALTTEDLQTLSSQEIAVRHALLIDVSHAGETVSEVEDRKPFLYCSLVLFVEVCHLALKEGIVKIVRTFGDRLSAFRFPPQIARKLQGFVDYN